MLYNIYTFSKELEDKYPVFLNIMQDTHLYYSYQESLLSIISGTREYDIAHHIMNVLLDSFCSSFENKTIINNTGLNNDILDYFLQINDKLIGILQKYYDKSNFNELQYYNRFDIKNKLNLCRKIIVKILKTPKIPNVDSYNKISSYKYDFHEITNHIILFYYLVKLYEALFTNNNMALKHINNKEVFVSEFFMFLSHFTFAYLVDRKANDINGNKNNAVNFILNNLQRAISHLERGILDILKIIVSSLITSKDIDKNKLGSLLAIRQEEYFLLSQNTEKRAHSYIIWLSDLDILKNNYQINSIIENIINHFGYKI